MIFNPVKMVGKDGKMLPAIRNLITLVLCVVFFGMGWFGHMNWSHRAEADQLVEDAEVAIEIREEEHTRTDTLTENIYDAAKIEQTECKCGDATDIEFMLELRSGREERSKLDRINPF